MFYYTKYRKIVIFNKLGVPPNLFQDLRGAANQKRLKNTALDDLKNMIHFKNGQKWPDNTNLSSFTIVQTMSLKKLCTQSFFHDTKSK